MMAVRVFLDRAFIIRQTRRELANGIRHFNQAGIELFTIQEILDAFRHEGGVELRKPDMEMGE